MQADLPFRRFRYIEVISDEDLEVRQERWTLVDGWIERAESMRPGSPKAILGDDETVTLPSGVRFRKVSFKSEHQVVEEALPSWASDVGRRWAKVDDDTFIVSDGSRWPRSSLRIEGSSAKIVDVSAFPWLAKIKDETEREK